MSGKNKRISENLLKNRSGGQVRNCYIHVPFCASKCGYCAFYSEVGSAETVQDAYIEHLAAQLAAVGEKHFDTLYIGGGTPTFFSCDRLAHLTDILRNTLSFSPDAEISIEANPETLTPEKIAILRSFFNRISIGVQSFHPALRQSVGRKCSDSALQNALAMVKDAAFDHWNIDLIYALPGQNLKEWQNDLSLAGASGADHISCYSLTPEEGAEMGGCFAENDELEAEMFDLAGKVLADHGIMRYEISNYAVPGCECRHNVDVWRGGFLTGFGPSAAGFDGKCRYIEPSSLAQWLKNVPAEKDEIPHESRLNEIFAVNLRTTAGWSREEWQSLPFADNWENRIKIAEKLQKIYPGALTIAPERIKLSETGLLYWNNIAQDIL